MRSELADLAPQTPTIPIISTTYEDLDTSPVFDAEHWATNMRNPVRFQQAITAAGTDHHTFIEISAHPLLTQAITDTLEDAQHETKPRAKYLSIGTLQRDTDDTVTFRTNLYTAHTSHAPQTPHPAEPHPQIPTTPWQHTQHWLPATATEARTKLGSQGRNGIAVNTGAEGSGGLLDEWSHQVAWPVRPFPNAEPSTSTTGRWLVVGNTEMANEIARVVGSDSAVLAEGADPGALLEALSGVDHVLYAPPVAGDPLDVRVAYQLFHQVRRLAAAMVAAPVPAKLFLVTRNAQPISEGDRANPAHGVLWGLGRTLALEHPEIWGGITDFDDSVPAQLVAQQVLGEAGTTDGEDQVVYRSGCAPCASAATASYGFSIAGPARRRCQPAGHRGYRQYRAASDPPAHCDGRQNHRRGVTQSRSTAPRARPKALPQQGRTWSRSQRMPPTKP